MAADPLNCEGKLPKAGPRDGSLLFMSSLPPETPSASELLTSVSELRAVLGKLQRRMRRESGLVRFNPSQIAVLRRLFVDPACTITELAQAEHMRSQSMGAIVASLQEDGLVEGQRDPTDGRKTLLTLTPAGRHAVEESRIARDDWLLQCIRERCNPADQVVLMQAIPLLTRLVNADD
jgi:DNA-binding MarR family transcriptional regulator